MADLPPLPALPSFSLQAIEPEHVNASKIVQRWIGQFLEVIEEDNLNKMSELFVEDCYWRDCAALSWTIACKKGTSRIHQYLKNSAAELGQLSIVKTGALIPKLVTREGVVYLQSGFTFTTKFGSGQGVLRLANTSPSEWRAWTVSTILHDLAENIDRPVSGLVNGESRNHVTVNGSNQPETLQVLVVGGGQSGVTIAAWLKHLGLRSLILEKGSRLGQAWWSRYKTVQTHTPSHTDDFPFLPFPTTWPYGISRDRLAGWIEHYAEIMELDYEVNVPVQTIEYDQTSRLWSVIVKETHNSQRVFKAPHVVFATGVFGPTPSIPDIPGIASYMGSAYHSSEHTTAARIPDVRKKTVTIIGCGTSAHDIAQDFVAHGAKAVSMIQRTPIWSVSTDSIGRIQFADYCSPDMTTDEADQLDMSWPLGLTRAWGVEITQRIVENDKELMDKLESAGLHLKRRRDDVSLIDHQLLIGGHYYIDQGADKMIVDGRIGVHWCDQGVKEFHKDGLTLHNGNKIYADIVVLATGFKPHNQHLSGIIPREIWDKVGDLGEPDEDEESIGLYRPTGVPGFWRFSGGLRDCRQYSKVLALQILAVERGWVEGYWES
ncbi:flavin-containing monooxygenase [Aspergillus aculeatinus CBS 121060]|uniref:Monooxygenase n=1 Tax=Aspergillus aculeatinus CBS 121060 TaxID=1448322 RepID=A0ACD1H448_9EURO|nr:monooxygenase [Aspergillus aculeatinus CBS 121060]RAH68329.1 monooxygenase [Aspergillus aculeatinus CBS 121060]